MKTLAQMALHMEIIAIKMDNSLTVVIKPTRDCNLRCKYCSVGEPDSIYMSPEIAKASIEKIVLRSEEKNFTKFIWHGGEPLLLGIDFYKKIIEIERPLRKEGYNIKNVVQTNGTLITDEWAKFLRENYFGVGLSIDGPKEINDLTRVFDKNIGSFEAIQQGTKRLEKQGVEYGYLTVISKYNVSRTDEIIDFMVQQGKRFKLVAVSPIGRAAKAIEDIMMEGDHFSDSQIKLFERWMNKGNLCERSALWKYAVPVLTGDPIECLFQEDCQKSFIGVDSNGDVYPCGRFCGGDKFKYGNIGVDSFEDIWNNPLRLALKERSKNLPQSCQKCQNKQICNGGCPLQGHLNGGIDREDYNCGQYKRIFNHIRKRILQEIKNSKEQLGRGDCQN